MRVSASQVRLLKGWALFLFLFFCGSYLWGQSATGSLEGVIQDASGGRVDGARVVVRPPGASLARQAASDSRGQFRIDGLLPGNYQVAVDASGFGQAHATVAIRVTFTQAIIVTLKPIEVKESLSVQGQASSITAQDMDTTNDVHGAVVTARDLAAIPLANRSFANVAYLAPGTEPVEPSDPTKARTTAVSFGGSSGLNVQLSVDGGDNSDDYIGGFLQDFSVDAIQEFAVRTSQEDADTGRTTAGSVVISTKRGTDGWHGNLAFYERAAALNARFPIDNPAPNPKQPFSRHNEAGTLGGPIRKGKLWFFSSYEGVQEHASIAYSPASLAQFNSLASLARQGLIPGANSIQVPDNVPVPFGETLASTRLDWSQSQRSQWFMRTSVDNYLTRNDLVEQGALPSTGATSYSNYFSGVLSNQYSFTPAWFGTLTLDASLLHHTEQRNQNLGFGLAFPLSSTASTISGFETFGDNQFVTPITAFPVLRNQQKYQFRYDLSHAAERHAPRLGIELIHEPVLSGALAATAEVLTVFPLDPTSYVANPSQFSADLVCGPNATPGATCTHTPAANGNFSQNVQRLGFYGEDAWRALPGLTIDYGLRYDTTFGLFAASGRSQAENPASQTLKALNIALASRLPHDYRGALAPRLGIADALGRSRNTVIRAGFGLF